MLQLKTIQNPHKTLLKGIAQIQNHHWTVNAGTALGLYRDKDLIPTDTDIDVIILTDTKEKLDITVLEGFNKYQFTDSSDGLPVQRAFIDSENGCIFDIYFYYRDLDPTGQNAVSPYTHDLNIPLHLYESRTLLDTKYGQLYFPSPIEDYLLANYGDDWMIPLEKKGIFHEG